MSVPLPMSSRPRPGSTLPHVAPHLNLPERSCATRDNLRADRWIPAFAGMTMCLFITGCTVGPDYLRPATAVPAAYKEAAGKEAGWQVARPADATDRGAWWSVFRDPVLDGLERQIDVSNQNLKADVTYDPAPGVPAVDAAEHH